MVAVIVIFGGAVMSSWGEMQTNFMGPIVAVFGVGLFAFQLQEANKIGADPDIKIHPIEMN